MLTHHRLPVQLSLISTDLPVWSVVETAATLYQKDCDRYHLLLTETQSLADGLLGASDPDPSTDTDSAQDHKPRLLWLELSPYRVIMTMQSSNKFSYRHFWEQGVYGISRYWLQEDHPSKGGQLRLRNFTRSLVLRNTPLPTSLRVEYELWSEKVALGRYILNLDIQH